MNVPWIVPFGEGEPAPAEAARLGGKGAGLLRLFALGLPVPAGFVVTVDAFRRWGTIREDALPNEHRAPLWAALDALGGGPVAVRSSAVAEDSGGHSFAGLHETVLDVRGPEALLAALTRCWASSASERAVSYRRAAGLPDSAADMAVVVQRMVNAERAGVLFTRDPLGSDDIVCEAVEGAGEALVSGRVSPQRWTLARDGAVILSRPEGIPLMDDVCLRELAAVGLRLEAALGGPQDIEWAQAGGRTWLLQARPITALPTSGPEDRTVWSNTNVGELLPEVCPPMSFSVVQLFVADLFGALLGRLGLDLGTSPLLGLVGGRVYVNMNAAAALMRRLPGMGRKSYADFFGGDQAALREALAGLRPEDQPEASASGWRVALRLPGVLLWVLSRAFRPLPAWVVGFGDEGRALAPRDLAALPDAELPARIRRLLAFMSDPARSDGMAFAFVAVGSAQFLGRFCRRFLGDADGSVVNRLLSGLGGVASAEAALDLGRLAQSARELGIAPAMLAAPSFGALRAMLEETGAGKEWLARWGAFLEQHGHHARGEMDVALPRWSEEPDFLFAALRGCLEAPPEAGPLAVFARSAQEREALEARCRRALNPLLRRVFNWLLVRAQLGVALREGAKSEFVRRVGFCRAILLEAGARLLARGALERVDEVFLLDLDELPAALDGSLPDLTARTARRRAELATFRACDHPAVVVGRFDPRRHLHQPAEVAETRLFRGICVSPGVAEGPARVILSAASGARVLPGEVLIAPFTDPGWTPYFLTAAAVVMDLGGVLSHGAVVAREVGVPAVVNVGPATRCIRTGQRVRVVAFRGEVTVLDETGGGVSCPRRCRDEQSPHRAGGRRRRRL
jgi:pyruvate,water dikinase